MSALRATSRVAGTKTVMRRGSIARRAAPEALPEIGDDPGDMISIDDQIAVDIGAAADDVAVLIKVYRVAENNKPESFLFHADPAALNIQEHLRDVYGTGLYRVRVYKNSRLSINKAIAIEAPPRSAQPPALVQNDVTLQLLERMDKLQDRLQQQLQQPPPGGSLQEQIANFTALATALRTIAPPPAAAPAAGFDLSAIIAMLPNIREGIETVRDIFGGGGSGEGAGWVDVLRDVIKGLPIGDIVGALAAARGVPPLHLEEPFDYDQSAPPAIEAPPPAPGAAAAPPIDPALAWLQPYMQTIAGPLSFLIRRAQQNAPVDAAANWLLDTLQLENVPDQLVADLLQRPDLLQIFHAIDPRVAQVQPWFMSLLNKARQLLFDPTEDDGNDAENEPGGGAADRNGAAAG
jgi:hypothetical protein